MVSGITVTIEQFSQTLISHVFYHKSPSWDNYQICKTGPMNFQFNLVWNVGFISTAWNKWHSLRSVCTCYPLNMDLKNVLVHSPTKIAPNAQAGKTKEDTGEAEKSPELWIKEVSRSLFLCGRQDETNIQMYKEHSLFGCMGMWIRLPDALLASI